MKKLLSIFFIFSLSTFSFACGTQIDNQINELKHDIFYNYVCNENLEEVERMLDSYKIDLYSIDESKKNKILTKALVLYKIDIVNKTVCNPILDVIQTKCNLSKNDTKNIASISAVFISQYKKVLAEYLWEIGSLIPSITDTKLPKNKF